jgi:hypothetical protein
MSYYDGYGDSDDSDNEYGGYGGFGFSASDVEDLACQGVKPWDDDAADVLAVLNGDYEPRSHRTTVDSDDDSEVSYDSEGGYGKFTASDCEELAESGIKPWDNNAAKLMQIFSQGNWVPRSQRKKPQKQSKKKKEDEAKAKEEKEFREEGLDPEM